MGACPSNIIPFSAKKQICALFHFPVLLTFQDCNLEKYDNELPSLVLTYSQKFSLINQIILAEFYFSVAFVRHSSLL